MHSIVVYKSEHDQQMYDKVVYKSKIINRCIVK